MNPAALAIIAALAAAATYCFFHPYPTLRKVLEDHDRAEADLAALELELPFGGAACGCFWQYLDGGHLRIWTCDAHSFICAPDGET